MTAGPRGPTAGRDAAFQRLWTKYAALPQYDKAEWTAAFNEIWESPGAPPAARRAPTEAMIDAAMDTLYASGHLEHRTTFQGCRCAKCRDAIDAALRAALAASQETP